MLYITLSLLLLSFLFIAAYIKYNDSIKPEMFFFVIFSCCFFSLALIYSTWKLINPSMISGIINNYMFYSLVDYYISIGYDIKLSTEYKEIADQLPKSFYVSISSAIYYILTTFMWLLYFSIIITTYYGFYHVSNLFIQVMKNHADPFFKRT